MLLNTYLTYGTISLESLTGDALGAIDNSIKLRVINTSEKTINITYSSYLSKIPRVTQQDWFDATKTGIWDIKPEIAFRHSSRKSTNPLAMVTAYFPGDFYLRMDLMMEAAQAQSNDAAASAST